MNERTTDERIIKAVRHPLRRQILTILDGETASSKEIADRLREPLATVSYHVGVLRDLELLEVVGQQRKRGAVETHYRSGARAGLTGETLATLAAPRGVPKVERGSDSARDLADDGETLGHDPHGSTIVRRTVCVDSEGAAEVDDCLNAFWDRLGRIDEASGHRSAASSAHLTVAVILVSSGPEVEPTSPSGPSAPLSPGKP